MKATNSVLTTTYDLIGNISSSNVESYADIRVILDTYTRDEIEKYGNQYSINFVPLLYSVETNTIKESDTDYAKVEFSIYKGNLYCNIKGNNDDLLKLIKNELKETHIYKYINSTFINI